MNHAWQIVSEEGVDALRLAEIDVPDPGPGQVRVRLTASSINYRDLSTIENAGARGLAYPTIPNSDAAGQVVATGPGVSGFRPEDRVMTCFFQDWVAGPITAAAMASASGGARQGMLATEVILPDSALIATPDVLTDAEAACLPCAALTAWHALTEPGPVLPGETVVLLGTGGVSVFAQQFCNLMGAKTIVTSSSDEKLARMHALGAGDGINYRTTSDWDRAVLDLTDGVGADRIVEVGGPGTLPRSINAVRVGGTIALIGILTGVAGQVAPTDLMRKSITVRGIYVGSRQQFATMNRAILAHGVRPVIDYEVPFADAPAAYHAMRTAAHFGKIVIRIAD